MSIVNAVGIVIEWVDKGVKKLGKLKKGWHEDSADKAVNSHSDKSVNKLMRKIKNKRNNRRKRN